MNLHDLKNAEACPCCLNGSRAFNGSGSGIEPSDVLAGGCEVLAMTFDEYRMPDRARVRCHRCQAVWSFEYRWEDRPPLLLFAVVE